MCIEMSFHCYHLNFLGLDYSKFSTSQNMDSKCSPSDGCCNIELGYGLEIRELTSNVE